MKAYFLQRLGAYLIDIVVVMAILVLISLFIPTSSKYTQLNTKSKEISDACLNREITVKDCVVERANNSYQKDKEIAVSTIAGIVVNILYFGIFQYYRDGQTLGKKLLKIKIKKIDGTKLSLNDVAIRSLLANEILANIICLLLLPFINGNSYLYTVMPVQGIDILFITTSVFMVLFRKDGKAIHDMLLKTQIISIK